MLNMCISIPIAYLIPLILGRLCHKYELVISVIIVELAWDRRGLYGQPQGRCVGLGRRAWSAEAGKAFLLTPFACQTRSMSADHRGVASPATRPTTIESSVFLVDD